MNIPVMKFIATCLLCLLPLLSMANMASPYIGGTEHAIAITSRDITVLHEQIFIGPEKDLNLAHFVIDYDLESTTEGRQIPLLFVAEDYYGAFNVVVDGHPVALPDVPRDIILRDKTFSNFKNSFDTPFEQGLPVVRIGYAGKGFDEEVRFKDLKYFEVNLSKGRHHVKVTYDARWEKDRSGWVTAYHLNYALSPARHWKSFGTMDLILDARALKKPLTTNLRQPDSGSVNALAVWHFNVLPADFISINHQPEISFFAKKLIAIGPWYIALIIGLMLACMHLWAMVLYRKQAKQAEISWVMVAGSLLIPLLYFIAGINAYSWIDRAIGQAASRRHGYEFLAIVFYVVVMPVYWAIMWVIDRRIKRRLKNGSSAGSY